MTGYEIRSDRIYSDRFLIDEAVPDYINTEALKYENRLLKEANASIKKRAAELLKHHTDFSIQKVIFNDPYTIVIWKDKSKTIVKCGENDIYDPEKGLAMCVAKKALGSNKSKSNYYDIFRKWLPKKHSLRSAGSLAAEAMRKLSKALMKSNTYSTDTIPVGEPGTKEAAPKECEETDNIKNLEDERENSKLKHKKDFKDEDLESMMTGSTKSCLSCKYKTENMSRYPCISCESICGDDYPMYEPEEPEDTETKSND